MMKMKYLTFKLVLTVLFFLTISTVYGQIDDEKDKKYAISIDLNYISDAVFMGRKDSISSPYLYPSISYLHKSGIYVRSALSYLTKSNENRIDLFLITAGVDFTIDKFNGDISASKYFFNDESSNVISQVEADLEAKFYYDLNIINLSLGASLYFNKNSSSDFFITSEISHDIITPNHKFQFSPTIGAHLGSQNFYEAYYTNRQIRMNQGESGNGPGGGNSTGTTQIVTEVMIQESEKFDLMALELSLPMWYVQDSFTISFLPALVFPQNEATIVIDNQITTEKLDETFYWMLGISYKFN